jgi:glutamine amidotransferase
MKLVIIDYGMGNIKSISSAFQYLGVSQIIVSSKYEDIKSADKLLLPGVGSFSKAVDNLNKLELNKILDEIVIEKQKPILGICLGMQLLCQNSEEDGGAKGLSYVDAVCKKFTTNLKIPHVGFNQVKINKEAKLFDGFDNNVDFYFTHSYRLTSEANLKQSLTQYDEEFISAYEVGHILGTQFHPELSQTNGLKLLKNFIEKF